MITHQVAHQVATPRSAHETRTLADVAETWDETPLTRQLFTHIVTEVVGGGGQR